MEEKHLQSSEFIKDIVIGVSDGLTVPFALAAGLSGAVSNTGILLQELPKLWLVQLRWD
jgi:vacuolar iron transporter family protein